MGESDGKFHFWRYCSGVKPRPVRWRRKDLNRLPSSKQMRRSELIDLRIETAAISPRFEAALLLAQPRVGLRLHRQPVSETATHPLAGGYWRQMLRQSLEAISIESRMLIFQSPETGLLHSRTLHRKNRA